MLWISRKHQALTEFSTFVGASRDSINLQKLSAAHFGTQCVEGDLLLDLVPGL